MATLPELQKFRDDLFAARLGGVRRLRDQNGEEVEYRSDREMVSAIEAADRAISAASGRRPILTIRFQTSKGL